jgi:hypothetical protein
MTDSIHDHLKRMRESMEDVAKAASPLHQTYVVYLMGPGLWLGPNNHWELRREDALQFKTRIEAVEASTGYDVVIQEVIS